MTRRQFVKLLRFWWHGYSYEDYLVSEYWLAMMGEKK